MKAFLMASAAAAFVAFTVPSAAQDSMPGTVFSVPDPGAQTYMAQEDQEVETDLDLFLKRGFVAPDWKVHERHAAEAARDVAVPDYVKRTGRDPGEVAGRVEIAAAMLTNPDFRDLIVLSRLPGDCDEAGCLFQLWTTDGKAWRKRFEFQALAMAYKEAEKAGTFWIAAVGDSVAPSRLYLWDGTALVRQ